MDVAQFMQYLMANNIGKILNSKTATTAKIEQSIKRFTDTADEKFRLIITENLPAIYLVDVQLIVDTFINLFDSNNPNNSFTYKQVLSSFTVNGNTYNIRDLYTEEATQGDEDYDRIIHSIHTTLWNYRNKLIRSIISTVSSSVSKTLNYADLATSMGNILKEMNEAKNAVGILASMSGDIDVRSSESVVVQNLNRNIAQAGKDLQAYYAKHTPSKIKDPKSILTNYDETKHILLFGGSFEELKTFINRRINGDLLSLLTVGFGGKSIFAKGTSISFAEYGYIEDYGFEGNRGNNKFFREQSQKQRGQVIGLSVGNLVAAGHTAATTTENGTVKVLAINTPLTIKTMLALNAEGSKEGYNVSSYVSSTPHLQYALQFTKEAANNTDILASGLLQFVVSMDTTFNSVHLGPIEKREIDKQVKNLIHKKTDEIQASFIRTLFLPKTLGIIKSALRWSPTIEENIVNNVLSILGTGIPLKSKKAPAKTSGNNPFVPTLANLGNLKLKIPGVNIKGVATKKVELNPPSAPKLRNLQGRFTSTANLQVLLNVQLQQQIKDNMTRPALQNQTGRFAESVKVERMSQSREGMITAFYSYMKSPYQTFEPGFKQGSAARNPKTLISKSIREIASGLVGNRLRAVSI
jgi:hypothetical protein